MMLTRKDLFTCSVYVNSVHSTALNILKAENNKSTKSKINKSIRTQGGTVVHG